MPKNRHVVIGVTGSIAAYKACDVVRRLQDKGYEVTAVMTREAGAFITPLTLSALTGRPVCQRLFDEADHGMSHIRIAQSADVFLVAPATANILAKIASGLADDPVSCMALSTRARLICAPAMNDVMLANPVTRENIDKLKKRGVEIIEPVSGKLACGTVGEGHLADVETIVSRVQRSLKLSR